MTTFSDKKRSIKNQKIPHLSLLSFPQYAYPMGLLYPVCCLKHHRNYNITRMFVKLLLLVGFLHLYELKAWQPTAAAEVWKKGVGKFYNFDFSGSLKDFRDAVAGSGGTEEGLEYQYWLSKALWVEMLDAQTDINVDFMTATLERSKVDLNALDHDLQNEFLASTESGIQRCQTRLKVDPEDLTAFYYLAAFRSNKAAYELLIESRRFAALSDIKQSMRMFSQVLKRDPSRVQALALTGLGHYLVGSNPWYIRVLNPLIGLDGTTAQGIDELGRAAAMGNVDAKFILKSAFVREGRPNEALDLLQQLSKSYPRNISFLLQMGELLSQSGRGSEAQAAFNEALRIVAAKGTTDSRNTTLKIEGIARNAHVRLR